MLREVFRTEPLRYLTSGETGLGHGGEPYHETLNSPGGITGFVVSTMDGDETKTPILYILGLVAGPFTGGGKEAFWVYDGITGRFIRRVEAYQGLLGHIFLIFGTSVSRKGVIWARHYYQMDIHTFNLGASATALPGQEPKTPVPWSVGPEVNISKYKSNVAGTEHQIAFGVFAIDDSVDILLNTFISTALTVNVWSSGKFKYVINFPEEIVAICLEDSNRCYILLANRILMLFDYTRGEVLGAAKVPPLAGGAENYWNNSRVQIAWDPKYRRVLLLEITPDKPLYTSTTVVRGFSVVNVPDRLTIPLPIKAPRQGRTIPVLVQVVDDMNHGVGGYAVDAIVTGFGSLAGTPITDFRGDALIPVACVGSPLFSPTSPPATEGGGGGGGGGLVPPDTSTVPSIGKSCWVIWFEFTPDDSRTLAYIPPGNGYLWIHKNNNPTLNGNVINAAGTKFAQWVAAPPTGGDPMALVDAISAEVAATSGPAVVYWDARTWPKWPTLRSGDWLCIQAYCRTDETPSVFEINMRAAIEAAGTSNQICLVCQCYTSNTNNTTDLAQLVPVYARLARDYNRVTMLLAFTDQGRATGLNDHPAVKPWWEDLYQGVPSAPALPGALMVEPMRIEPTTFDVQSIAPSDDEAELFASSPVDTGSNPSSYALPTGRVKVVASITVLTPKTMPITGLPTAGVPGIGVTPQPPPSGGGGGGTTPPGGGGGTTPPGGGGGGDGGDGGDGGSGGTTPPGGGTPGPPGGGVDPGTNLPETAPNMRYIVDRVLNSKPWDLHTNDGPNGLGAFIEAAITAIHDVDARFGFVIADLGSEPSFNGHTVNSVMFKNPDGTTGEKIIIVTSMFALGDAKIVNAPNEVKFWAQTASITEISFDGKTSRMKHSKQSGSLRWPTITANGSGASVQWSWWLFIQDGSKWVGSAFRQMGDGAEDCGGTSASPEVPSMYHVAWYKMSYYSPMPSIGPITVKGTAIADTWPGAGEPHPGIAEGDRIAMMASTGNQINDFGPNSIKERSNIVEFTAIDNGVAVLDEALTPGKQSAWVFAGRDAANYAKWRYPASTAVPRP